MDEFLRDIKNEVKNEDLSFSKDGAWSRFSRFRKKRDQSAERMNPSGKYWAVAAGILLLFSSNAFWYKQNKEIQNSITEIQRDTVYITQYISTTTNNPSTPSASETKNIQPNDLALEIQKNDLEVATFEYRRRLVQSQRTINELEKKVVKLQIQSDVLSRNSLVTTPNQADSQRGGESEMLVKNSLNEVTTNFSDDRIIRIKSLTIFDPNFVVGRQTAFYFPPIVSPVNRRKKLSFSEFIVPKTLSLHGSLGYLGHIKDDFGFTSGTRIKLGLNSLLSDKWRLKASLSGNFTRIEDKDISKHAEIIDFVIPEGSSISEIVKNESSLSIKAGIDYLFKSRSFLRPFIGLGYERLVILDNGIKFELKGLSGNFYIEPDHNGNSGGGDYVYFSVGTDINIRRNLDAFVSMTYSQGLSDFKHYGITFNPGIYYHF